MITISDIAKKANVSRGTVDRVIHNRGGVAKDNIVKVKEAMKELNYRPNIFARGLSLSKTFTFGVLIPDKAYDVKYWQLPKVGIDRAQASLEGYKVKIRYFFFDSEHEMSFQTACRDILKHSNELDGLLMTGAYKEGVENFLKDIPKQLPYILFDSRVPNADYLSFIGTDSTRSGETAARLLHLAMHNPGHIAILKLKPESFDIENRVKGFLNHFKKHPQFSISIHDADCFKDKFVFTHLTKTILNSDEKVDAFFVPSSAAHDVAEAAQFMSSKRKIHIVGYDLTEENCYFLKTGTIDFLINCRPELQGYRGISTLYRHIINREKVEKNILMPFDIVTFENVDYYLSDYI